jgi:hypothetical protein
MLSVTMIGGQGAANLAAFWSEKALLKFSSRKRMDCGLHEVARIHLAAVRVIFLSAQIAQGSK